MDDNDRKRRPSRWGEQPPANFRPNGPPQNGPFMSGPGGPMGGPGGMMGGPGGPMLPRSGKGLLGQAPPLLGNGPKSLMSLPVVPPVSLMQTQAFPPGYGEGSMDEDQIKSFLKAQREALQGAVNALTRKLDNPQTRARSRSPEPRNSNPPQQQNAFQSTGSLFGQDSNPFGVKDHGSNSFVGKDRDYQSADSEPPFKRRRNTPSPTGNSKDAEGKQNFFLVLTKCFIDDKIYFLIFG